MRNVHIRPFALTCLVACLLAASAAAQEADDPASETPAQRDARMRWWREAKFGMFIHWGVYAVPAGVYDGKPIGGIGEWIMHNARIPVARYREYAQQFTAARYDADAWVRLAKQAGMKYVVITSKHHDGFALFDSKASDWNVVKATPHGKDLLRPLAEACRRHGLKLGFYYSQAQDWSNPGGAAAGGHWDPAQAGSMDEYIRNVAMPQVQEILTSYGKDTPDILWWDTPVDMNPERAEPLYRLAKRLKPDIITNNRLGVFPGDTETPEQYIPATGFRNRDWEVCMTMNDTWGYKSTDNNWKDTRVLIHNLVDIVSMGGNYLLNVGPTAEGVIPQESVTRLEQVGRWMRVNRGAVYGTTASPFRRLPWGRCTVKAAPRFTTLYLHVFDWPADGRLVVPGLKNKVLAARTLAGRRLPLAVHATDDGAVIEVPREAPDPISSTIMVRIEGVPRVEDVALNPDATGSYTLRAGDAVLHGATIKVEGEPEPNVGFWTDAADWMEWVIAPRAGRYRVTVEVATPSATHVVLTGGNSSLTAAIPATGDYRSYRTVEIGTLDLAGGQRTGIALRPPATGWTPINVRRVMLKPEP